MGWVQSIFGLKPKSPEVDINRIIRSYGAVMEATSGEMVSNSNVLPLPKSQLSKVLILAIANEKDEQTVQNLEVALVGLGKFVDMTPEQAALVERYEELLTSDSSAIDMKRIGLIAELGGEYQKLLDRAQSQTEEFTGLLQLLRSKRSGH